MREFEELCKRFLVKVEPHYEGIFPPEPEGTIVLGYLFARAVRCPYCDGQIPLSPNWSLSSDGSGVQLLPALGAGPLTPGRVCRFEIVHKREEHSEGTVNDGDARCPYPDCARVVDGDEIKRQAQAGDMGSNSTLSSISSVLRSRTKAGKLKEKWERGFRAPREKTTTAPTSPNDWPQSFPNGRQMILCRARKSTSFRTTTVDIVYMGAYTWTDMFSPRQLLCHGTSVEVYRELLEADRSSGLLTDIRKAAYVYLSLSLDKLLNYNSRMTRWIVPPRSDGRDI